MKDFLELIGIITVITLIVTVTAIGGTIGLKLILTQVNINMGPYKCIDIDGNEVICEQTWRSDGILYGITKNGRTIDLKSYETIKE